MKNIPSALAPVDDNAIYRRRCSGMLRAHRQRARALYQTVDYSLAQLVDFVKANRTCTYCGGVLTAGEPNPFSLDHAIPTSVKADFRLSNLRTACVVCQERKGDFTEEEYRDILNLASRWRPAAGTSLLRRLRAGGAQLGYKRRSRRRVDFGSAEPG
jgi:5-methylcytosine-specific restriction endonuclease McrA